MLNADELRFMFRDSYPKEPLFPDNILHIGDIITLGFEELKWINNSWIQVETDFIKCKVISMPFNSEAELLVSSYKIEGLSKGDIVRFSRCNLFY